MGPTETLANYIANAKLSDFPEEVVLKAKHAIANEIGCAIGGAQTELGQRTIAVAKDLGGKPESAIIGDGTKISSIFAAHANTELGETLDFDDEHKFTLTHPSCAIIGSALALGEAVNVSGKDLLLSVLVGYEVGLRVARAMRSIVTAADGKKEVLSNPTYNVFSSIAASSKILKLEPEKIINAFGLAGSTPINRGQSRVHLGAAGPHPYTDNKFDMGIYSYLGVFSTLRARRIAGPKGILDSDRWWTRVSANNFSVEELAMGLGKIFRIMEMSWKPVPFCAVVFAPVTAIWQALKGEKLDPADIEEIKLIGIPKLEFRRWNTMVEAQFSTPAAVAFAVLGEEPGPDWYTTGRYKDPDVFEIASKVTFEEDPRARPIALEKGVWISTVEIKTKDGKVRRAFVDKEKGSPANPHTPEELFHKFVVNSRGIVGEKRAEELWDKLMHVEKIKEVSNIVPLLH